MDVAAAKLAGTAGSGSIAGVSLFAAGDTNADGYRDVIVGAMELDANGPDSGAADTNPLSDPDWDRPGLRASQAPPQRPASVRARQHLRLPERMAQPRCVHRDLQLVGDCSEAFWDCCDLSNGGFVCTPDSWVDSMGLQCD